MSDRDDGATGDRDPVRREHVPVHDGQTLSVFDHGSMIRLIGNGIFLQLDEDQRALLVAAILPPGAVVIAADELAALRDALDERLQLCQEANAAVWRLRDRCERLRWVAVAAAEYDLDVFQRAIRGLHDGDLDDDLVTETQP